MQIPNQSPPIGFVQGAIPLLAEVLVFEGMGVSDVGMSARDKVVALVGGIGVVTLERPEGELGVRNGVVWEE